MEPSLFTVVGNPFITTEFSLYPSDVTELAVAGLENTDDDLPLENTVDCVLVLVDEVGGVEFVHPLMLFLLFLVPFFNISSTPWGSPGRLVVPEVAAAKASFRGAGGW